MTRVITRGPLCLLTPILLSLLPPAHGQGNGNPAATPVTPDRVEEHREYDPSTDPFYQRKRIFGTWIMIWNGSTETRWWKPEDYNGCKVLVAGRWQSINWNDRTHIKTYVESIKAAGINLIAVDFTNGFRWKWQAKYVQQLCHENEMKFVVAFNPQDGSGMEKGCRAAWETYAAPGVDHSNTYFHRDGKPLVVLYTWRKGYTASVAQNGPFRQHFTTAWASGEDSAKDKWGWQLEPEVGPVPSGDVMFLTGSVKFDSPRTAEERWRKHLAWLDYGFLMARESQPRILIVGSFDDVHERNAWMVADTRGAKPGWQMRDTRGALSPDAYYRRVSEWLTKGRPETCGGGMIRDGAYQVVASDGRVLGVSDNRSVGSRAVLKAPAPAIESHVWFYHLGGNEYRMIKLNAGLTYEATDTAVIADWDDDSVSQRWLLRKQAGHVTITSKAQNRALDWSGEQVITSPNDPAAKSQRWSLVEIRTLPQ